MRFALDSNILLYCEGLNDERRSDISRDLIEATSGLPVIIPIQVLGEAFAVLVRKMKLTKQEAAFRLKPWRDDYTLQETSEAVFENALDIMEQHDFQVWDAIILAAASLAGADYLFSEDMQDGFAWNGTEIVNPFAPVPHPIVPALLNAP
jgi:predicted nucleic acid-binding protein